MMRALIICVKEVMKTDFDCVVDMTLVQCALTPTHQG